MKKYLENPDIHGVMIVTFGTYLASFFSYLLQFFLGRLLSVEDYGLFNTYLAISYILGVPAYVLSTSVVKYVADLSGKGEYALLSSMYRKFQLFAVGFGLCLTALIVLYKIPIESYLKIEETPTTVLYALVMGFSYFIIVPMAYLQGFLRYRSYSLTNVTASLVRFLFPVLLLLLGFGLTGVFAGMLISSIITYSVGRYLLRRNLIQSTNNIPAADYKRLLIYSLPLFFINLGLILLNNIDLILVKRLFSATEAGYYAGTVTLGKILLFGSSTVSAVMFPRIANEFSQKKVLTKSFMRFFGLQFFIVLLGATLFSTLPGILTQLFFGDKFTGSIQYLPGFSIFVAFYVLVNFLILFLLAIEKNYISIILVLTVLTQYYLLNSASSVSNVIAINITVTIILFLILLLITLAEVFLGSHNTLSMEKNK